MVTIKEKKEKKQVNYNNYKQLKIKVMETIKKTEKNLTVNEEKIELIKSAAKLFRVEQTGANAFCRSLLDSEVPGIRQTLANFNLVDKQTIFDFIKQNAKYVNNEGNICKKVSNKDCSDVKQYVVVARYTINLLTTAVVGHLTERQKKVVDCNLYYDSKGNIMNEKQAAQKILEAKVAAVAQAAQEAKIAEIKDKVYNDYISSQSK